MNIGSLEVLLGVNTAGLSRAAVNMRRFESQVLGSNGRMQASFQALGSQMMLTGTMLTQFLTVPLALLGGAAVTAFAKFETVLAKTVGLTSFSSEQVKKMAGEILELSTKVNKTPVELAEGLYFIGSSGIKDAAMAMDILTLSAQASRIGLGETKKVADALTSVLNAYGHANISAAQAADTLVAAVREGKGEADDLAGVIGHVMPLAVQLGVAFSDVAGSLAALTLTGKSASEASTQMARLFTTLIQQPPEAEAALERMGISFARLRSVLREGGMVPMLKTLKNMVGGTTLDVLQNSKAYEQNITVLGDVFTNIRALLPVLDMLGPNMKQTEIVMENTAASAESMNKGLGAVSNTIQDRFGRSVKSMQGSLINLGNTIKDPLMSIFDKLTKFINNLISSFNNLPAAQKEVIMSFVTLAAIAGPLLLVMGQIVAVVRVLWGLLMVNPITATITFFLALAAAIYYVWKYWDLLVKAWNDFSWQRLQQGLSETAYKLVTASPEKIQKEWEAYLTTMNKVGSVADSLDALAAKQKEYSDILAQMETAKSTDAIKASYDNILKVIEAIYNIKIGILEADEAASKIKNPNDGKSRMAIYENQRKAAVERTKLMLGAKDIYNAHMKAADGIVSFGDVAGKIYEDATTGLGKLLVKMQKFTTGFDFSNIGGGYGIGALEETKITSSVKRMQKAFLSLQPERKLQLPALIGPDPKTLINASNEALAISIAIDTANKELKQHEVLLNLIGNGYNKAEEDATTLRNVISTLTGSDLAPSLDPQTIKVIQDYIAQLANIEVKQKNIFRGLKELVGGFADIINSYGNLMDSKKQKELDWIDTIAKKQHKSDLWIAKEKDKINAAYSKKLKAIAIAQAIINGALAITAIWRDTIDPTGVGIKLAASALSAANTAIQIATIAGTNMARGGMVPSGFPNDSFPAMLTSGETVIPLNKVSEIFGKGAKNEPQQVVFRIDGRELVGVLSNMGKLQHSY